MSKCLLQQPFSPSSQSLSLFFPFHKKVQADFDKSDRKCRLKRFDAKISVQNRILLLFARIGSIFLSFNSFCLLVCLSVCLFTCVFDFKEMNSLGEARWYLFGPEFRSIWVKIAAPTKLFVPQEGAPCDQEFMGSNAPGSAGLFSFLVLALLISLAFPDLLHRQCVSKSCVRHQGLNQWYSKAASPNFNLFQAEKIFYI